MRWFTLIRVMAIVMLLLAGTEVFACELLSPETCELIGNASDETGGGDDCLCCCAHVMVTQTLVLDASGEAVAELGEAPLHRPVSRARFIYHPPKA